MKTWLFIRNGVIIAVECCVDKPPDTMVDGLPSIVFEVPNGVWVVGDPAPQEIGNVIIGNGIPDNKLGENSWVYVDVDTGNVYRKTNFTWF
jgi:hypothetical protein